MFLYFWLQGRHFGAVLFALLFCLSLVGSIGFRSESHSVKNTRIRILFCADNDPHKKGYDAAVRSASATGGLIVMPETAGYDFNDLHKEKGLKVVAECIIKAEPAPETKLVPRDPEPAIDLEHLKKLDKLDLCKPENVRMLVALQDADMSEYFRIVSGCKGKTDVERAVKAERRRLKEKKIEAARDAIEQKNREQDKEIESKGNAIDLTPSFAPEGAIIDQCCNICEGSDFYEIGGVKIRLGKREPLSAKHIHNHLIDEAVFYVTGKGGGKKPVCLPEKIAGLTFAKLDLPKIKSIFPAPSGSLKVKSDTPLIHPMQLLRMTVKRVNLLKIRLLRLKTDTPLIHPAIHRT